MFPNPHIAIRTYHNFLAKEVHIIIILHANFYVIRFKYYMCCLFENKRHERSIKGVCPLPPKQAYICQDVLSLVFISSLNLIFL